MYSCVIRYTDHSILTTSMQNLSSGWYLFVFSVFKKNLFCYRNMYGFFLLVLQHWLPHSNNMSFFSNTLLLSLFCNVNQDSRIVACLKLLVHSFTSLLVLYLLLKITLVSITHWVKLLNTTLDLFIIICLFRYI